MRRGVGLIACVLLLGCSSSSASEPASGGNSSTGASGGVGAAAGSGGAAGAGGTAAGGGGGVAGSSCSCTAANCTCVPAADSAWIPVIVAPGLDATCPPEFPVAKQGGTNVVGTCGCSCGTPQGLKCDVQVRQWPASATDCSGADSKASLYLPGSCYNAPLAGAYSWIEAVPNNVKASCTAYATKIEAKFEDSVTICQATLTPPPCAGGHCVADAPGFKHCMMTTQADVTALCPAGYAEFKEYYLTFDNQAACSKSGCYCSPPSGGTCSTFPSKCSAGSCGACTLIPEKACVKNSESSLLVPSNALVTSPGNCAPMGNGSMTGSLTPKDKRIVCCTG
ncbi:MAG: hypothetical protein IPI67_32410 [Myxococcales bacterium]|nr:hypothetical protein [Myxococcales bacterium]